VQIKLLNPLKGTSYSDIENWYFVSHAWKNINSPGLKPGAIYAKTVQQVSLKME
jgi:hypothetical protein